MRSPLALFLTLVFVAMITLWSGCATTEAYKGPEYSTPIVQLQEWTHWNTSTDPRHPFWEKHRYLVIQNPTKLDVQFVVDCENNYFTVDVPGKRVQRLLITREDGACDIKRVR